ncbi:MAG: M20/M25/M40 family metallo-hydrolase [Deltaproteobacteria bacterium]|nr:M20/M25/M40 family metallo-hydrolase [Deltaproteobacteria bacterium]
MEYTRVRGDQRLRTRLIPVLISAWVAACAASGDPEGASSPPPVIPTWPTAASLDALTTSVRELSADAMLGRLTGSASGALAETYVYDKLAATGIEMTTQEVPFPLFEVEGPASLQLVDADGAALQDFAYIDEFREVDFSGSGAVSAGLVFAGFGLVYGNTDPYAGLDVSGKVVLLLSGVPAGQGLDETVDGRIDKKLDLAHQHGAAGVIFALSGFYAEADLEKPKEVELAALDEYADIHPELLHAEMPAALVHLGATEKLVGKSVGELETDPSGFDSGRKVRLEIHGTTHAQATCNNVFGILRGEDPTLADQVILVGAHYDHLGVGADGRIFHGAGDNGSGTAVVLEAARAIMASGVKPKRTVVFALWCAEEQGLRGSLWYGHYGTPLFPLRKTALMIQVDYLAEEDGPYITNLDDKAVIQTFLGDEQRAVEMPIRGIDWGGECASDDCVFLWKGVPAYRFIAYGAYHHMTEDTFEHLNMSMVRRVGDVVIRGIGNVAYFH